MAGTTLIPGGNSERIAWALNWEEVFPTLAADLGFTAAETTSLVNDAVMMRLVIMNMQNAAAFSKSCTAFKNEMLGGVGENVDSPKLPVYNSSADFPAGVEAGILERLSKAIQRLKLSSNYNQTIGEQLMIAGEPENSAIEPTDKPKASGTSMTGSVNRIEWTKGKADGVFIESQRGDETVWTRIGFDMRSPFEDDRPPLAAGKPEERRYRLIYFVDNKEVGAWSDIITVITQP